jgi:hypothetical protein
LKAFSSSSLALPSSEVSLPNRQHSPSLPGNAVACHSEVMKPSPPSGSYPRAGRFVAALAVLAALLLVAATTGAGLFGGALRNRCYSAATGAVHAAGERRRRRGMVLRGLGIISQTRKNGKVDRSPSDDSFRLRSHCALEPVNEMPALCSAGVGAVTANDPKISPLSSMSGPSSSSLRLHPPRGQRLLPTDGEWKGPFGRTPSEGGRTPSTPRHNAPFQVPSWKFQLGRGHPLPRHSFPFPPQARWGTFPAAAAGARGTARPNTGTPPLPYLAVIMIRPGSHPNTD